MRRTHYRYTPEKRDANKAKRARTREIKGLPPEEEKVPTPLKPLGKRGKRLKPGDDAAAKLCKESVEYCELGGWKFDCIWNGGYLEAHHLRTRLVLGNDERQSQDMLSPLCVAHHHYANTHGKEVKAEIERRRAIADGRVN